METDRLQPFGRVAYKCRRQSHPVSAALQATIKTRPATIWTFPLKATYVDNTTTGLITGAASM
jgi:hypothetical protein